MLRFVSFAGIQLSSVLRPASTMPCKQPSNTKNMLTTKARQILATIEKHATKIYPGFNCCFYCSYSLHDSTFTMRPEFEFRTEKRWQTSSGLTAVVIMTPYGTRNGYVGLDKDHPLYGKECWDFNNSDERFQTLTVHGGLTFSGFMDTEDPEKWYLGFDCSHWNDAPCDEFIQSHPELGLMRLFGSGFHRTLDFCVAECEDLATQLFAIS
jgi:hypothetical protein